MYKRLIAIAMLTVIGIVQPAAAQQPFPNRPVRVLVGFAAGGPTDQAARIVADKLAVQLGQPVVIDNRPGANGLIAVQALLNSAVDGYTLLLATTGMMTVGPARFKKLPYAIDKDFSYIGSVAGYPHLFVVPAQSKATDLKSFIKLAQSVPGHMSYASVGHLNELTGTLFQKLADTKLIQVSYKGDGAVIADLVANRIDLAILAPSVVLPLVQAKKIRILATTGTTKTADTASVPTMREAGLGEVTFENWNGLVARAGTSPELINKLSAALHAALRTPEVQSKLAAGAQYPIIDSPADFQKNVAREADRWRTVARDANLPLLDF